MTATFESINEHLANVDFDAIEKEIKASQAKEVMGLGDLPKQLCTVFAAIRPILILIKDFPLIPEKWRKGVALLITLLDGVCQIS